MQKTFSKEYMDLWLRVIVPLRTGREVTKKMAVGALANPHIGEFPEDIRERLKEISEGPS